MCQNKVDSSSFLWSSCQFLKKITSGLETAFSVLNTEEKKCVENHRHFYIVLECVYQNNDNRQGLLRLTKDMISSQF